MSKVEISTELPRENSTLVVRAAALPGPRFRTVTMNWLARISITKLEIRHAIIHRHQVRQIRSIAEFTRLIDADAIPYRFTTEGIDRVDICATDQVLTIDAAVAI